MDFFPITQQLGNKTPVAPARNEGQTDSVTPTTDETVFANSASEQAEDFDTFLTLLTAQISNQDPLEPVDSTQFVEQLATFSNLELQAKNNQILEGIASLLEGYIASAPTAPSGNAADGNIDPISLS